MSEFVINLDDQSVFQNNPALHSQVQVDVDRDANPERRGTLMPSELIMGPGKPYKVHVAFKDPDRKIRWKGKDTDKAGNAIAPWVGTNLQYTLVDTPNGEHDGQIIGEFIMTMVSEFNKTCSAQAFLQGVGAWNPKNPPRTNAEYIQLIEQVVARGPVMGIHTDWEGQEVSELPDGTKKYDKVDGLNSWRAFPMMPTAPGQKPMPSPRIPILDKDGKETGRSYVASSRVVRREAIAIAPGGTQGVFGQAQASPSNPFGQASPAMMQGPPMPQNGQWGQPPQSQFAPPQQFASQPASSNTANLYQQQPAQFQAPTNPPQQYAQPPQQQAAYVPPQPMTPPQQAQAPQGQPQQPQQGQPANPGAPAWQQPGPSFR